MAILPTKGLRVLEEKVNETEVLKTVFSHLNETCAAAGKLRVCMQCKAKQKEKY